MALTNQQIGDLGEDQFQLWAKAARMTVTKPDIDEKGWDRFVEWTLTQDELQGRDVPLDLDDSEVKALVQVKTTTNRPGRWRVKLSNWKSLVEYPGPAFFAVLEAHEIPIGGIEVERLYVVHIGETLISRYLKQLRKLDHEVAGGAPPKLNKIKLSFSYGEVNCTEDLTPAALRAALSAPLESGPDQYAAEKKRVRDSTGYQDGRFHASLNATFKLPSNYDGNRASHFADVLLCASPLRAAGGTLQDIRFGISSAPRPIHQGQKVKFKTREAPVRLRIRRSGSRFDNVQFDAVFQDGRFKTKDGLRGKIRFQMPYASITIVHTGSNRPFGLELNVPGDTKGQISEIWDALRLAVFLCEAIENGESVQIQKKGRRDASWIDVHTLSDKEKAASLSEQLSRPSMRRLISVVRNAWRLAREANIESGLEVTPAYVAEYDPQTSFVDALRERKRGKRVSHALYLTFCAEKMRAETQAALKQHRIGIADLISIQLGSYVVLVAFAFAGEPIMICSSVDGKRQTITSVKASEEEAAGLIRELPAGWLGYKIPIHQVDFLEYYVFDAEDELPNDADLRAEALEKAKSLYAGTLTRGEEGLSLSV